ncbi:Vacuolar protein sorting-associated protein 13B, partial [Taenia solium]
PMQKIFSIETYLGPLLMRYIGKYVKLRDDQFQLSLWGGDAVLNYVELQYDIFEDLMPLPVGFKSGHVHELRIQVPWTRLGSSSIVITLNTVECVLVFKRPGEQRQRRRSEADASTPSDAPQPPSYLLSYLTRIWSNIEVVIKNLIVKFVEGDAVISLNIRSLDCFPTLLNWQRGVMAQSAGNYCLHRLLRLTDMTLCIDRCDAKGHISTYQDPVMYRSNFDIRLQTVFTQNNNGLASICVANLFSPRSVEVNLNQVQVPLIARILEILVALSNNIIRWEVLSDGKSIEKPQNCGQHKEVVVGSNEEDLAPNQSWSQWAWSFVPSFPSFSSTSSEDDIYDFDQDDTSLEYIGKLRSCEARAEYVRLLYEDGLASTKETAKMAQYRRGCLYRLRNHKKPLPALVLGVLMKKIRFHIKAAHRTRGSESTQNKASTTKNLRPNESTFNLFTIFMENLGFQFVRDSEYFSSLQVGVGLLQISPFGEVCPCGKQYSMLFPLHDLLALHSKSELLTGSESSDPLIKAFCGLFGVETSHSSDVVDTSTSDNRYGSNRGVIDAQPSLPNSFVLPPFCRKDYHSTYGPDYPQNKLPLALWFESVFCREVEEESIEDEVKVNFTLTTFHRLQNFLELLAEGSKNYKACSDWASLYVLPQQEPVDSWILQERMVRLRSFTPINVKRVQLKSLFVEMFPPTHDHHVANRFASLKLETGSIDAFVSAPLNPVQLVFTMTHLYPSSGVLVDVKSSFHQGLLHDNTLECKQWGGKEQISDCYGIYQSTGEQHEDDVKKSGVLFGLDDENPITKPLQIDLLNSCYAHQLLSILASTLYIVPTTDLLSTCGFDAWLTSLDATSRGKVVQLTLPRVEIRGPCSRPFPLPQSQNVPPPAPISTTEMTGGIRLYGFELEEKQALEIQQRLRRLQSVPEMEAMDLDPNHSTWKCTATGIAILIGEATRLLQVGDLACTLSFTITTSQPNNTPSRISWNLLFDISDSTKNASGDSPRLRDIIHFMAAISRIQKQISNLISEIYATKDLVASHIRKSKDVDSLSNATTPVEVAPCGMEPFSSTKKPLSMGSRVTYSSSHSVGESRNALAHLTPLNISCTASRIPLKGTIQVTLPNTTGELCLNDEQSKILWEADDFSSTISVSDHPFRINFRLQLERICLFLQTSERCFPLISPKHWHIRPFQNVTFCPGTAYHEELKADQRRPKPQEPQGVDSDSEVDVTLSRHLQPTALLTVSFTRSSAVPVGRVFAGKQFSHWLDRQSELFLQGEDRMKVDDVGPPFVNCVYIKLKPLDVVLCPQLVSHLKGALRELQDSEKIVSTDDRKFFNVEAPLPGHCMPLLFMALDELRLFVPSPGLLFPTYGVIGLCDALAITLRAIQIHPFPTNCITSRPEAASSHARAITLTSRIGSSHEDRQFALRLEGLACWAVSFLEALNFAESARRFDYQPTLAGQYPAFEWNQAATSLNDTKDAVWVLPVLRPLDITAVFAAPVCETNLTCGQARLLCSSILEVNTSNDIIVTLNGSFLSTYLSNLMSVSERPREQANETAEVNQVTWPFQPSRILLTCGLLRFVLWERRKCTEPQWDFSVIELIQPHLRWSPEALNAGLNDLQVHLRTFSEGSESDWRDSVFWTPTKPQAARQTYLPTRLPLPRVTEVGQSQIFNPASSMEKVCFSSSGNGELLLINFSRQNPKEERFQATIHIQRATTLVFTPNMLMCLSNLRKSFSLRISPVKRAKHASDPKALITAFITIFGQLNFGTHSISLHLISSEDEIQFVTEGIQMAGIANQKRDSRSFCANLKVMCINAHMNDFQLIPTATEISLRLCTEVSPVSIPTTVVHIEISRGTKIVIPFGNEFKRLTEAFVVAMRQESYGALNAKERIAQHLPSRYVFKDDFSIFVPTEPKSVGDISQWLPLPYEVIFAECDQFILRDGTEPRCVTMTWTFPELRQPVRLTVNPIPFVYDNDAGDLGIVMLPARLQYWSAYVGEYGSFVTYATFNLLEDAPVDVPLPPTLAEFPHCSETLAQAQRQQLIRGSSLGERDVLWGPRAALNPTAPLPVAATTWRIIVSCVGRTIPMRDSASAECGSVAIPVFLSPYALAACTHLDSAYIPELTTPVSLHVRLDDFCLSTWQACRPIKEMPGPSLEMGRLTVLKLHGILATSFKSPCNQAPAITSAVDQSIKHADSTLLASFSVGSVAIHVFSPHGAHMQLLGEAKRIFGVSGACISVGACHLYCNSDLVHALSQVTTGEGKTGWEINNRTDRRILVEQYFTSASPTDEPAASALSSITSVVVEAGGCCSSWRPIILAKTQTITLRIALSAGPSMVRSAPIPIIWPPEHTNSTLAQPIRWDDPGSQDDSFPSAILLIPSRPSSGPPGEASIAVLNGLIVWIIVQPTLTVENKLPFALSLHLPNGSTTRIAPSSSYGLCVSPEATSDLALSALDTDTSVTLTSEDLTAQGERILWLPVAETVCPVILKVNHLYYKVLSAPVRLVSGRDNTPVFESSLLLPWRKLSGRLDVVVQPWLLISNRSGISLQLFTASSLKDINLPDESAVKLDPDSCHIPAAGERLFRFGIKFKGDTVWSPALLVHSSVFSSSTTTASETFTLTVSGVSRARQQRSRGRAAAAEAVVSLRRSRTLVPLALRLGRVVCCLAARLHSTPPRGVVTLSIEPLLRVDNRTGLPLLCKPIVTPTPHVHLPLPVASLDELGVEVLALPKSGGTLTPILFWNHSHPEVVFEDVDPHDGDSDECSLLLNLSNDLQTGLWTLYLDNFAPSLSCPLGCTLTNTTDFPFEASFHSLSDFHQLPVSNALPCVQPSGGKLVLIPQISLDHLAGVWVSGVTPEASASSAFLCHEDVHLFLRLHSDDVVIKLADCRHNPIQLRFGDKTVLIQQVSGEVLPFCTHLAIFTDQKPVFSHWSHVDQPLSLTVCIDTTLIFASVCGSILTPSESGLKDFLRICIRRIEVTYLKKENASLFEFSITSSLIQVDNLAQISQSTFDFPVLIRSVLPHTMEENSTGVSSCTFQIHYLSSTDFIIDGFDLRLPSVEAYIEDTVLYALASWVQDLRGALPDWVGEVENAVKSPTSTMLCLRKFEIHPVLLQLALKVKVGMHISCKTTQFRLNKFECSEAALDMKALFSRLSAHYISQVLIRAGLVLGSLELIGNPACLVASFAEGVWDLVHFADSEKMATQEQLSPLRGLARGLVSLVKHTTGGMCSSLTGLASSVARNLHELSLDAEHIQRTAEIRQHHQPAGLGEGLALGISEFGISLLGGLAGVAHHPLFALLQSQPPSPPSSSESPPHHLVRVAEGFAGGVGRGLIGLLAKPLAGVADFVAFTGAGFMHGMGTGWGITPSPNHILTNLTGVSHLVDGALLHKWSCALMRCLNIPHPHEYLWTGVGVDATRTVLTWLCLPCRGSLFTIEFEAPVQTVRAGVLAVDFVDTDKDVLINRYQLPAGERIVLMRILRSTKNTRTAVKADDVSARMRDKFETRDSEENNARGVFVAS